MSGSCLQLTVPKLNAKGLVHVSYEQEAECCGCKCEPVLEYLALDYFLSLSQSRFDVVLLVGASQGIKHPVSASRKEYEQHLIHQKLEGDDYLAECVLDLGLTQELALVAEDTHILEGRVIRPHCQNLPLVGCYSDGTTVLGNGDQHVLNLQLAELLIHLVELVDLEVGVLALNPVVIILHAEYWILI